MSWINQRIPDAVGRYTDTSDPTETYNCVAWAAGDDTDWWSHLPGYKWPGKRSPFIEALVEVFESLGYAIETEDGPKTADPQLERIALYARNGFWKHAARQLPNGKWTSKLGIEQDIQHDSAECLCCYYGQIHCYMRRQQPKQTAP